MKSNFFVAMFAIAVLFVGVQIRAATTALSLADHTPADAVAYFGWAGSETLAPAFAASSLRAFVDGSNARDVIDALIPKLFEHLAAVSAEQPSIDAVRRMLPILWRHPCSAYVTTDTDADGALAHFGLLCEAGTDADALIADTEALIKEKPELNLQVTLQGSIVRLANYSVPPGVMLTQNDSLSSVMTRLQSSPAICLFVHVDAILKHASAGAARNDSARDIWPKIRDALGIANIQSFAMTAGFDGANWATASALIAPGPRAGVLAAFEPRPIDPALLARIPGSAEAVAVYNFDTPKLFDSVAAAMAVTKSTDTNFHRVAGAATMVLGRNFRRAILGPLGPQWIIYTDSQSRRTAMLNRPADADTASDSMVSAAFGIINTANAQIPGAGVTAVQQKLDGIDITCAKSTAIEPFVGSPAFAVQDGVLYFGGSPDSVVASAKLPPVTEAADFLHDSQFATALYCLRVPSAGSIDYYDLTKTAPAACNRFKAGQMLLGTWATMAGVDLPTIDLPPIEKLKPQLSPAISVSWADSEGVYTKSVSPFPGSAALLGDPQESVISVGSIATAAAFVMPALAQARDQATLAANMSNERQLILAMITWSVDHQGAFPPDLGTLVGTTQIDSLKIFLRHGSGTKVPPEITAAAPAEKAAWVNEHAEFSYLTANKKFAALDASTTPVLIEKGARKSQSAVGFADGHVEACSAEQVQKYLDSAGP